VDACAVSIPPAPGGLAAIALAGCASAPPDPLTCPTAAQTKTRVEQHLSLRPMPNPAVQKRFGLDAPSSGTPMPRSRVRCAT
jgi:hypothetical protein